MSRTWLAVLLVAILPVGLLRGDDGKDLLKAARDRAKIEAERVKKDFADGRVEAYKLVKTDDPKLAEATDKLRDVLRMLEKDTYLDDATRQQYVVTIKWDLDRVKEIAAERTKKARVESPPPRREPPPRSSSDDDRRSPAKDAKSEYDRRKAALEESKRLKDEKNERSQKFDRETEKGFVLPTQADEFPRDWVEKSRKRGNLARMSAKEKAIMESLNKTIDVEFSDAPLTDVLDYLRKKTGIEIAADKKGMDDAGVTYETRINLKMKASTRNVIRKLLADLGLAYYVKDEVLQITSLERAKATVTTRTYYVGDLAQATDTRLPYYLSKLEMIQTLNSLVEQIKSIDPQSWKDNNPEAPGTIVFEPRTMSLVVSQTAEFHLRLGR